MSVRAGPGKAEHANLPVCVLMCVDRWSLRLNSCLHSLHWNGRSPECNLLCLVSISDRVNDLEHWSQWYFFALEFLAEFDRLPAEPGNEYKSSSPLDMESERLSISIAYRQLLVEVSKSFLLLLMMACESQAPVGADEIALPSTMVEFRLV